MADRIELASVTPGAERRRLRVVAAIYEEAPMYRFDLGTFFDSQEASELVRESTVDALVKGIISSHRGEKIAVEVNEEGTEMRLMSLNVDGKPLYSLPMSRFAAAVEEERPRLL